MTTLNPAELVLFAQDVEAIPDLPSATNSGIRGDLAHAASGGYHISIEDQVNPQNYSVVRVDDKAPPGSWPRNLAAANDLSMNTADMVRAWNRIYAVWANPNDPRRKYWNAFNGWNGVGSAERLDFKTNTRTVATSDHKWHCHDETPRRYVNDPEMRRAKVSAYRGESIAQYILGSNSTTAGGNVPKVLIRLTNDKVYLVDGTWARFIGMWGSAAVEGMSPAQAGSPNLLGPFGNGGQVANYGTTPEGLSAWGKDVDTLALTPAQITAMAQSIAQQVIAADTNELTPEDLEAVTAAAAAGIEEAVGNLQFTSTTETHAIVIPE